MSRNYQKNVNMSKLTIHWENSTITYIYHGINMNISIKNEQDFYT